MATGKTFSSTAFWARHLALALIIIIVAAVVLKFVNMRQNTPVPEGADPTPSVAEGLSDFYAAYRLSSTHPYEDDIGDFVMEVNKDEQPLQDRLKGMESLQKPVSNRWVGAHKYRTFKTGTTLREAITNYAQSEGMQVLWELDQDFIVKHQFQMDDTIVGSLQKIARAVDSNFEGEVRTWVCPKQRSLVITNHSNQYLLTHCNEVKG